MTPQLKVLFIYRLRQSQLREEGFTLLELLVVVIIMGVLGAIATPTFLNQAAKARQAEAQTYVSAINRGQQMYYLEQGKFSNNLESLGLGIPERTEDYSYVSTSRQSGQVSVTRAESTDITTLRDYAGRTWVVRNPETDVRVIRLLFCEGTLGQRLPSLNNRTTCP
ncbi:MAG TPA: prepilin-type N-terminal cleavage/methylation domain-containing protein [Synechococcales cyanobacterium M55_K2018_004]|nr:prepilin-type N-terminal cleavage/methylation domain-containing protein [Synechococcales cyanobacterium M55_K2018_004]